MRLALLISLLLHVPFLAVRRAAPLNTGTDPISVTTDVPGPRSALRTTAPSVVARREATKPSSGVASEPLPLSLSSLTALGNRPPAYPDEALRNNWEGEVRLLLDGRTAHVTRSSGYAILDEAALTAARTWRLPEPEGRFEVPVIFRIDD